MNRLKARYQEEIVPVLKKELGVVSVFQVPALKKIVVNFGVTDPVDPRARAQAMENIKTQVALITGQAPQITKAKKAIANFKLRQGDPMGVMVTLRGARMYGFLDKLINVAIPRTKDFRGISRKSVDDIGNLTIGIKEHTIFPETADEDIRDVFGLSITLVCTAKTKKEGTAFFELLGIPFKKEEEKKKR